MKHGSYGICDSLVSVRLPIFIFSYLERLMHQYPPFYGCYLLRSDPQPSAFYIGSSPNPYRRLRQHNRELAAGGAYRTKAARRRPWSMIALVYGFPSSSMALSFEHSLQNASSSRYLASRDMAPKSRARSLKQHLINIKLLLNAARFRRLPLSLSFFNEAVYHSWCVDTASVELNPNVFIQLDVPSSTSSHSTTTTATDTNQRLIQHAIGSNLLDVSLTPYRALFDKSWARVRAHNIVCNLTKRKLSSNDLLTTPIAVCPHFNCEFIAILPELARVLLEPELKKLKESNEVTTVLPLVPMFGKCPCCKGWLKWHELARNACWLINELEGKCYEESGSDEQSNESDGSESDTGA